MPLIAARGLPARGRAGSGPSTGGEGQDRTASAGSPRDRGQRGVEGGDAGACHVEGI